MEKFTSFTGVAVPLRRSNVDTDQIIPAHFLKRVTKIGFDDALFYHWRKDASFVLNQPQYQGAGILVAGSDFGTGSSREHAVWALRDYGFQVVISARFADIFRGNAGKQGLLAAQVDESDVERIWQLLDDTPGAKLTVNLLEQTVSFEPTGETSNVRDMNDTAKGNASGSQGDRFVVSFHIDEYTRWRLLEGYDDISLTLQHEQAITEFEAKRPAWMPTTLPQPDTTPQ